MRVNNYNITFSKYEKLLGIKTNHKLNFNTHIGEISKKARQKLNAFKGYHSTWTCQSDVC